MEINSASTSFAALSHPGRLSLFRLLMSEMPTALSAGDIAERVGVPASTLSGYLAQLQRAGLILSERRERHIFYKIDIEGTRDLLAFFAQDCCQGRPEICGVALSGCKPFAEDEIVSDMDKRCV